MPAHHGLHCYRPESDARFIDESEIGRRGFPPLLTPTITFSN